MQSIIKKLNTTITDTIKSDRELYINAQIIIKTANIDILCYGHQLYEVLVNTAEGEDAIVLEEKDDKPVYKRDGRTVELDATILAAAMHVVVSETANHKHTIAEGRSYTRTGMMKRVLAERRQKALKAPYTIKFANNMYGEHVLTNEKGKTYKITLHDFRNETGYIDNPDWKFNKLGTTKHIMFVFDVLREKPSLIKKMSRQYPFVEIYTDPLHEYRISWHYPHSLPSEIKKLINKYFGAKQFIEEDAVKDFMLFLKAAANYPGLKIRPEVEEKVNEAWEQEMLHLLEKETSLDFTVLKQKLFPYQQQGVQFATFKTGAIIADEMGLGKTVQAIATAIFKKQVFGFNKTLVICPASLKAQWTNEIEKYSGETGVIADGFPAQRAEIYKKPKAYFTIINYETVLRDWLEINKAGYDFIILDEAQRIKNYSTTTAESVKLLRKKHALVITGTPIENKLIDLYSVMQFVRPNLLGPLWEFSYKHCYFDTKKADKITGYYDLHSLNDQLKSVLIRREKRQVLKDLPSIYQKDILVGMSEEQRSYHAGYASGIAQIIHKKFLTPYDLQKLQMLLTSMRMVCDSTFLIDKETHISPKLEELKYLLLENFDLLNNERKIIIFSEWVLMLDLIGEMLKSINISYVQLTGKVSVKNRQALITSFENNAKCKIFLSSEAGGTGLNLQMADTVINFELPWNPGKKNQRIGRIDRLGQRSKHLTVINFITVGSIEQRIAEGLVLKQNLFEGVLNANNTFNSVDFSTKGRSQFLQQIEQFIETYSEPLTDEIVAEDLSETTTENLLDMKQPDLIEAVANDAVLAATALNELTESPVQQTSDLQENNTSSSDGETMQQVMNNGMQFLAGLFKMATGKDMGINEKSVEIDKETGEVVMRFKMK